MDAVRAAMFEDVLKQSESAELYFERLATSLCADRPDGPERLAEIMQAHRAVLSAELNLLEARAAYPNEFPVFVEAFNAARNSARSASALAGAAALRG